MMNREIPLMARGSKSHLIRVAKLAVIQTWREEKTLKAEKHLLSKSSFPRNGKRRMMRTL